MLEISVLNHDSHNNQDPSAKIAQHDASARIAQHGVTPMKKQTENKHTHIPCYKLDYDIFEKHLFRNSSAYRCVQPDDVHSSESPCLHFGTIGLHM